MVFAIGSALSGLAAAGKRLEVSAANVANQHSTRKKVDGQTVNEPYTPQRVQQVSLQNGGVQAVVSDISPATTTVYDPDHPDTGPDGVLKLPNVSVEEELVGQKIASYDYKANLKTIKVAEDMQKNLLDILA